MEDVYNDLLTIAALGEPTKRPSVRAYFDNTEVVMLYDTGSSITCMSRKTYDNLQPRDIVTRREDLGGLVCASASGDAIRAQERPTLRFTVLGKTIEQPMYIMNRLHEAFIIGIDFIEKHSLGFCPRHREFYWNSQCPREHVASLGLKESFTIPALGRRRCKVKVDDRSYAGRTVVASVAMSQYPWIRGGPVLTTVNENGDVWVEIGNSSPITRELQRMDQVGLAEE